MLGKNLKEIKMVPVIILCITLVIIVYIPFRITAYGFLPPDDALRHAAKVISAKSWSQILVLRPNITMDSHPGWHAILEAFYKITACKTDNLVVFSVISTFLLFTLVPLIFLRYPESWMLTLIVSFIADRGLMMRLFLGRPYIFTMAVLVFILFAWTRFKEKRIPWWFFALNTLLIAASTWIHCLWHLLALPIFCFLLARQWRVAFVLSLSTIVGILLGASFTGQPLQFLIQTITHSLRSLSSFPLQRMLATEFYPSSGEVIMVITTLGIMAWRALRGRWDSRRINNPVFILALTGWILGLYVQRFWLDWGMPALLVWIAQEFDEALEEKIKRFSLKRVAIAGVIAITLFFITTSDINDRWTANLTAEYLSAENPKQAGWLPETGGIVYAADMTIFYQTFYKNPNAPWRYILGFEPTMMPEDDLEIYKKIYWNAGAPEAFKPWVEKMKPADRLIVKSSLMNPAKAIPELEWNQATKGVWIGRLPKK